MLLCLLTALGVGGATILGTALGFPCRKISHRFSDIVLAFAAGVMLSAAILGLILPAIEQEQNGVYNYDRTEKFDSKILYGINTKIAAIEK